MNIFNFKSNIYRKFGYISDQNGIISRYNREKLNWDEHLQNCKEYIISFSKSTKTKNIAILGSGWLLDVPIEFLAQQYKTVFLIDVNHPKNIRKTLKNYSNIELITDDITGGTINFANECINIFNKSKVKTDISAFNKILYNLNLPDISIISLNILNQLDIILIDYLSKFNIYNDEEIIQLRKTIQNNHLSFLANHKSCLISDIEEYIINKKGNLEKTNKLIHCQLPQGKHSKEWIWKFDTKMRYIDNKITHFKVYATELN